MSLRIFPSQYIGLAFLAVLTLAPHHALAQKAQEPVRESCEAPYESIVTLRSGHLGEPPLWDAIYGKKEASVQLASGVLLPSGSVMAVGRTLDQEKPKEIVIAELNPRGRVVSEKASRAKDGETPLKMVTVKGGYLVLSNLQGKRGRVRLAWFGADGAFKSEKIFQDDVYNYESPGFAALPDGKGYVLILHAVNKSVPGDEFSILTGLSATGQPIWRREFEPGTANKIEGLLPLPDKGFIAAGRVATDSGRDVGWVMKLGADGALVWQRLYPRGKAAAARQVAVRADGRIVVLGEVMPVDGKPAAAWAMETDSQGEPRWQRYYRHDEMAFRALSLTALDDGRLAAMLNAVAADGVRQSDHVRLLTLSPRGLVMMDEAYVEGISAQAGDSFRSVDGKRLVVSTIEDDIVPLDVELVDGNYVITPKEDAPEPATQTAPRWQGWVFVAPPLPSYNDPCTGALQP